MKERRILYPVALAVTAFGLMTACSDDRDSASAPAEQVVPAPAPTAPPAPEMQPERSTPPASSGSMTPDVGTGSSAQDPSATHGSSTGVPGTSPGS